MEYTKSFRKFPGKRNHFDPVHPLGVTITDPVEEEKEIGIPDVLRLLIAVAEMDFGQDVGVTMAKNLT